MSKAILKSTSRFSSGRSLKCDNEDLVPSAPPLDMLDKVAGYENLSFDPVFIPPPEPSAGDFNTFDVELIGTLAWNSEHEQRTITAHAQQVTEAEARSALMAYVGNHCCLSSNAARNMSVTSIRQNNAFSYTIETFTEKREARWTFVPHSSQCGDTAGSEQGSAPLPWELPATPTKHFQSEVKIIEVPYTSSIKQCHKCRGKRTLTCVSCHGKGSTRCSTCQGKSEAWGLGANSRERCIACGNSFHGNGRQDCSRCNAKGRITCPVCKEKGQLKCFIQLTVTWKVSFGEYIAGGDGVPHSLLKEVEGQTGLEEAGNRVAPLPVDILTNETLAMASAQLISEHLQMASGRQLLAQRHCVRVIPVTALNFRWKNFEGNFYLYGLESKVYAPVYPQTCCCGCAIL